MIKLGNVAAPRSLVSQHTRESGTDLEKRVYFSEMYKNG